MQLSERNEEAWEFFETAITHLDDPNPYIFSSFYTKRGLLVIDPAEDRGLAKLIPALAEGADELGIMKAGAISRMGRYLEEYGDLDAAKQHYDKLGAITQWSLIGPFENISASGFEKVFQPELEFKPKKKYIGKRGVPAPWFNMSKLRHDNWVDLTHYFGVEDAVYYGNTFVYSPEKQVVHVRVGTSGSLKTFLNDEEIISVFEERNNDLDTYIVETELQKGWNRLLIKCGYSEITQCNYLVRITDKKGDALSDLKYETKSKKYTSKPGAPLKSIRNFAEVYFEEQIEVNPSHIENYLLLADCYMRNDKAIKAELALRRAADYMPEAVIIDNSLYEAYLRGEKYDNVASTVAKIYDLYPDIPFVLDQKYSDYIDAENVDQAAAIMKRYVALRPKASETYLMKMNLAFTKGQVEEALAFLKQGYEEHPLDWSMVYLSAVFSMRTTQQYDGAIDIYTKFLSERRTTDAYLQLADIYLQSSDVENYEVTLNKLLVKEPSGSGVYYSLAKSFLQIQDYDKALKYINHSLEISPNTSGFWSTLAEIHQGSGKKSNAIKAYKKALKYSATDYASRSHLRELEGKQSVFANFATVDIDAMLKNSPTAEEYPNDDGVYLVDNKRRVVYEEGASEVQNEVLLKLFNMDGIDRFKEYNLAYNSHSEVLIIEKAVVLKADGTEIKADEKNGKVIFKSLVPNDHIYIKWRVQNYYQGRLSQHLWEEIHFNFFFPVKERKYSLLIPKGYSIQTKTQFMSDEPEISKTRDGLLHEWVLYDQPAIESEYNTKNLDDYGKMLFISTIPDWEYLVDWYLDLAKTKTRSSYEVQEVVAELLAGKPDITDMAKIELIYNYITENIRYSSVSFRQSGLIPQKARDVLVQRIGDCKDVATLCISMLKEAGIPAHYVLVNTFKEGLNKDILPAIEFNHAIAGVETDQGLIYMDLTAQNYPIYSVPSGDRNAFALSILPGTQAPHYLTPNYFSGRLSKRTSTVTLSEDNSAVIERNTVKSGSAGASLRNTYRFMGEEDRFDELAEDLSRDYPNLVMNAFTIEDVHVVDQELEYFYSFSVPHYLVDASSMKLLKIPWTDGLVSRRSLSTEEREYDYLYRVSQDTVWEEISIILPVGFEPMDMEETYSLNSDMAEYQVTLKYADGVITGQRQVVNKMSVIPPDQYPAFKEYYNEAVRADERQILLRKTR
ncbi:MAG: tetratricopeptide repeat protein [Candidatus Marinimicrobia bacterium]|nr:tetratricopeptide repeat protein [Candidatus Neomarinimicrobiota bacterium]